MRPIAVAALSCLVLGPLVADPAEAKSRHRKPTAVAMASGASFSGKASFYGNESGSRTASGQRFDQNAMTAAHRSLPFGTKLKVTYRGRGVVVTINDRGPFTKNKRTGQYNRVLDLSKGAARAVGLTSAIGVGHVVAEVL